MKQSVVRLSAIQRKAKTLQKEKSLKWHQALDEAAKYFGYSNYRNYQNISAAKRRQIIVFKEEFLEQMRSQKENVIAVRLSHTDSLIKNFKLPIQELLNSLKHLQHSKKSMRSLCEKMPVKEIIELHLLKDALHDDNAEIDDFAPYHIAKQIRVKNVLYKFDEDLLYVKGEYDLTLEFGFEYDKDEKSDFFDDQEMSGSFDLTIDRKNKLTIEDQSIGYTL